MQPHLSTLLYKSSVKGTVAASCGFLTGILGLAVCFSAHCAYLFHVYHHSHAPAGYDPVTIFVSQFSNLDKPFEYN